MAEINKTSNRWKERINVVRFTIESSKNKVTMDINFFEIFFFQPLPLKNICVHDLGQLVALSQVDLNYCPLTSQKAHDLRAKKFWERGM